MHEGNRPDYSDLVQRARDLKDSFAQLSDDLGSTEASGLSGGGMVRAIVAGDGTLVALELDPAVVTPDDPGMLADLVIDAVNDAVAALTAQRARRVSPMTENVRDMIARLGGDREPRDGQ